jgi:hypothetical protein
LPGALARGGASSDCMRPDLPSGTVTFLFTDVEGSTRVLHELGAEAYAAALAEHRGVIRAAATAHGGAEVDTQGDAFFFAFPTAPGGVAAARAITEELGSGPVQVRVGLHTGTPLLTDEGYVGVDVHRAARIAAAATAARSSSPPRAPRSWRPSSATSASTGSRISRPLSVSTSSATPTSRPSRVSTGRTYPSPRPRFSGGSASSAR